MGGQRFSTADSQCLPSVESGWSEATILSGNDNSGRLLSKDVGLALASVFLPTGGVEWRRALSKCFIAENWATPDLRSGWPWWALCLW